MKRFVGIFVFTFVTSLFSFKSVKASNSALPKIVSPLKNTSPLPEDPDKPKKSSNIITGLATYYAQKFEGGLTATGEIFRHSKFTAASNVFALNTWVRVTNLISGQSIIVRINDRMHPSMTKKGRILDLTLTGAKKLHIINKGIAKVKIEPISDDVAAN